MQNKKHQSGSIGLIILLIALAAFAVVHFLFAVVSNEFTTVKKEISRRQLQEIVLALFQEKHLEGGEIWNSKETIEPVILYPGRKELRAEVQIVGEERIGIRNLQAYAQMHEEKFAMEQLFLEVPLVHNKKLYDYTLTAGGDLTGVILSEELLYTSQAGKILDELKVTDYKNWPSLNFPDQETLKQRGWSRGFYYSEKQPLEKIPYSCPVINGTAFLVVEKSLEIAAGLKFPNRLIIIVGENVVIGNNVRLEHVLLLAKGSVRIGSACNLNGIVVSNGNIDIGTNFTMTRDTSVLAPFVSAVRLANFPN